MQSDSAYLPFDAKGVRLKKERSKSSIYPKFFCQMADASLYIYLFWDLTEANLHIE